MDGRHQPVQHFEARRFARHLGGQRGDRVAGTGQLGLALEQPGRGIGIALPQHAGAVVGLDHAGGDDHDLGLVAFVPHQSVWLPSPSA